MCGLSTRLMWLAFRSGRGCGCLSAMSTSQDYPNSTPTPATTTTGEGQRRGPSLREISQQELNTATQYMIDEHGYAAHEAEEQRLGKIKRTGVETSVVSISGFRWCAVHDGSSRLSFKKHLPTCRYEISRELIPLLGLFNRPRNRP